MTLFTTLPRKPFLGLALAAMAGIVVADWFPLPLAVCAIVIVLGGVALWCWPRVWLCWCWVAVAFGGVHTVRVHHGAQAALAGEVAKRGLPAEAEAVVWSEPVEYSSNRGEPLASLQVKVRRLEVVGRVTTAPVLCAVHWVGPAPAYGDVVRIHGEARALAGPRNPGEFDMAQWQRRNGVACELRAWSKQDCTVTAQGQGSWAGHFALRARAWVKQRLEVGFPAPEETALIESMVLGMRGETPPEMKEVFQKTGTLHLFAVSGLNVAMLAAIVWAILKPLRFSRAAACLVALPLLAAYAIATGLGASCVRATIMAVFVLMAPVAARPAVLLNSLAGSALAILAWDTNQLFLPGFQLSYVLVLCLVLFADRLSRRWEPWLLPDDFLPRALWTRAQRGWAVAWRMVTQAAGVTVAAWLGSLLFMAGYFHLLSPVALLANAIAVPISFVVLALGLLAVLVSVTPLLPVVNAANWFFAKILLWVVGAFATVPHGHEYVEWPRLGRAPACEIMVLDVGEGAAIHLRSGGTDWLLDSGHVRDYPRVVLPYLRSRGIDWLDGLLLTHGDSAHTGGAADVVQDFAPPWVADTPFFDQSPTRRALHAALASRQQGRRFPRRGDIYQLSSAATLRVLYPPADLVRSSADDKAMVCMVEAGGLRVLLASDAGFYTEEWLLKNEPELHADVLVKGWHASDFSGTPDFLLRVNPRVVITSAPEFGMTPDKYAEWAEPVAERGVQLFPQQYCGAVRIEMRNGGELRVEGMKK